MTDGEVFTDYAGCKDDAAGLRLAQRFGAEESLLEYLRAAIFLPFLLANCRPLRDNPAD